MECEPHPAQSCGCVDGSKLAYNDGRRGGTCVTHAIPRLPTAGPLASKGRRDEWYVKNTCPFCGRVQSGYCCNYVAECKTCGLIVCNSLGDGLRMGHYHLQQNHGLLCRSDVGAVHPTTGRPRTKCGREKLQRIKDHPELEATPEKVRALFLPRR